MEQQKKTCVICGKQIPEKRQKYDTCCKSCATKKAWQKPGMREKMSKKMNSPETKAKIAASVHAAFQKPEVKEKHSAAIRRAYENPEFREKLSKAGKAYHSSERHKEFVKAMNKPETKERMSKAQLARFADSDKHKAFVDAMNKPETKEKLKARMRSFEVQTKINATKHVNGSLNTSKDEDRAYDLLKEIFPDTVRQYFSERYPFKCDFYIPSIDLFIEGHFSWLHGDTFFDSNNPEHIKALAKDKENEKRLIDERRQNENLYTAKIYTWTDLDVRKKQWADSHQDVSILFFFSLWEFEQWLNNIQ